MQPADQHRFKQLMVGMAKVYEREIDAPLLDAYWMAMRNWSLIDFELAVGQLISTSKFMPRPADFNELLPKQKQLIAADAFATAVEHCRTSRWRAGALPGMDQINRAVAAMGGYQAIAMANEDRLPFLERQFAAIYDSISEGQQLLPITHTPTPTIEQKP
jgi:hypothetical protein